VTVVLTGCGGGTSSSPTTTSTTATAGTNVRVLARFTILESGAVTPPVVTIPAHVALELAVVSRAGRPHAAVLHIPGAKQLTVPAHATAEQLIPALPTGTYVLSIDGRPRGALHVRAG
jgi:hypothetical protein